MKCRRLNFLVFLSSFDVKRNFSKMNRIYCSRFQLSRATATTQVLILILLLKMSPFAASLFFIVGLSTVNRSRMFFRNHRLWLNSKFGSFVLEATALHIVTQPLLKINFV